MREPTAPARRPLAGLPGVLRAAGGELLDHHRAADQRGLRLHLDADQRAARRAADPHRGRLRRLPPDVPHRAVRRVQGRPQRDPDRVQGPGQPGQGGARRAADPGASRSRGLRGRRRHRHARRAGRATQGMRGADQHRRPRRASSWSATTSPCSTRARASPSWPGWTRRGGRGASTACRPSATATSPRWSARPATTCPACPASARRPPPSGSTSTATSTASIAHVDEIKGKAGESLREHLADVHAQPTSSTSLVDDLDAAGRARRPAAGRGWDREAVHQVFDALEFRVLRDRLYRVPSRRSSRRPRSGFDLDRQRPDRRGEVPAWLDRARAGRHPGRRHVGRDAGRAAPATSTGVARRHARTARRPASTRPTLDAGGRAAWRGLARPTPAAPKVLHDAKPAAARASPPAAGRWPASPATPRSPPTSPGPTSAPTTWPTWPCATCTASCGSTAADGGQLTLDGRGDGDAAAEQNLMLRARAILDLADALDAELDRRRRASARLLAEVELPLVDGAGRDGARRHRRRHRLPDRAGGAVRRARCKAAGAGRVRGDRRREFNLGSPKQLQEILFDELGLPKTKRIKTGYTTDADALQRPATRRPSTRCWSTCCGTATWPSCKSTVDGLLKSVADDGRIHTTFNQTVAATGRLSSHRPQPAEHPDPHRGGPADPPGLRRRRGLRVAADRRLQPDRDADHGAPVRGRGADRGVQLRRRLPRASSRRAVFGVAGRRGHPRPCAARSRR